jgi:hypothetical protein
MVEVGEKEIRTAQDAPGDMNRPLEHCPPAPVFPLVKPEPVRVK